MSELELQKILRPITAASTARLYVIGFYVIGSWGAFERHAFESNLNEKMTATSAIVFVSEKCPHSQELVKYIQNKDFNFTFNFVDLRSLDEIPSFVDRVPLIFTEDEKVLHDEELFQFVQSVERSVEPFMMNEMQGLSDYYSFTGEEAHRQLDHVYSFLDKDEELITKVNATESDRIVNYDKYVEKRADEMKDIFQQQSPASATA